MEVIKCVIALVVVLAFVNVNTDSHQGIGSICNIRNFGAVGDGSTLNTVYIQSAIDACSNKLNSLIYVPPGSYLTGTIFLRSNMTLYIESGATLLGSPERRDYPLESARWYVVLAENSHNVGITGGGEINGQSSKFVVRYEKKKNVMVSWNDTTDCLEECRPFLVGFVNSKNIHIWNVSLNQPAHWCLHILNSDHTYVHNISIYGDFNTPNNDGIDIDGSNNTLITDCRIDTGDDGISPKATYGPVYNVSVYNCWIRSKSSGIKLGSATSYVMDQLTFDSITIVDSHRGVGIQLRDPGNVHNVRFSNIWMTTRFYHVSWWGRAEPIYVTACPRNSSTLVGSVNNVEFVNITATSENGIFLAGLSRGFLKNVKFKNVDVKIKRWTNYIGGLQDYRPGCKELIHHRTSSIYMQNVDRLLLKNVRIKTVGGVSDLPMEFGPKSIGSVSFVDVSSSNEILP